MAYLRFLDFPITIRQQIYEELLVPVITKDAEEKYAYSVITTSIFYINREIHAESSNYFYAKNLFVNVYANSPRVFSELTPQKAPVFARVKNKALIAQCPHFAASVELRSIKSLYPIQSTSSYVITAQSLPLFFAALVGPKLNSTGYGFGAFTNIGAIGVFKTTNTFCYTPSRFSDLTYGRILEIPVPLQFSALRFQGYILPRHHAALMKWCDTSEFPLDTAYFTYAIKRVFDLWKMRETKSTSDQFIRSLTSEAEIGRNFDIVLDTCDIYWSSHEYRVLNLGVQDQGTRLVLHKFLLSTSDMFVEELFEVAKYYPDRALACWTESRRIVEKTVEYLNCGDSGYSFDSAQRDQAILQRRYLEERDQVRSPLGNMAAEMYHLALMLLERQGHLAQIWCKTPF